MNQVEPRRSGQPVMHPAGRPWGFERPVSLSEVLDRVLDTGAVLSGGVVISVAGVDLLYVGINVLVASVETLRQPGRLAESPHGRTQ